MSRFAWFMIIIVLFGCAASKLQSPDTSTPKSKMVHIVISDGQTQVFDKIIATPVDGPVQFSETIRSTFQGHASFTDGSVVPSDNGHMMLGTIVEIGSPTPYLDDEQQIKIKIQHVALQSFSHYKQIDDKTNLYVKPVLERISLSRTVSFENSDPIEFTPHQPQGGNWRITMQLKDAG